LSILVPHSFASDAARFKSGLPALLKLSHARIIGRKRGLLYPSVPGMIL
jgi:hypothetical protein